MLKLWLTKAMENGRRTLYLINVCFNDIVLIKAGYFCRDDKILQKALDLQQSYSSVEQIYVFWSKIFGKNK